VWETPSPHSGLPSLLYTFIFYSVLTDRNFRNQQDNQQSSAQCKVRNARKVFANKLCRKRPSEQEYGNMLFGLEIDPSRALTLGL
jgi:hypothetical protein